MKLPLITLLLALGACGNARETDALLVPFAKEFEREARLRGVSVKASPMVFVDEFESGVSDNVQAVCVHGSHIEIKRSAFKRFSRLKFSGLVFHEQGHCALGLRGHSKSISSLRSVVLPTNYNMRKYRDVYLDELFDTVNK